MATLKWTGEMPGMDELKAKHERTKAYRKAASKLASKANKRIARLEKNDFKESAAYMSYLEDGQGKFGVAGKTFREVQREVARLEKFLNSQTSTIRGANKVLKDMAVSTNMTYKNMKDLRIKSANFFKLADKAEEYLRNVDDIASAIGYQKVWEAINTYVRDANIDLGDANLAVDDMLEYIIEAIKEFDEPVETEGWPTWELLK